MVPPSDEQASGEEGVLFSQVADLLREHRARASAELHEGLIHARSELEHFFAQNPYSVTALRLLAECAQQLDDLPQARQYIERAELLDPWNIEILIITESLHETEADSLRRANPRSSPLLAKIYSGVADADQLIELALGAFQLGQLERAYSLAKLAYMINPQESHHLLDIWSVGAICDPKRTYAELRLLDRQSEPSACLYLVLGSICHVLGQYDEALEWIEKGLLLAPDNPYIAAMLTNEMAYVFVRKGKHLDRAVSLARSALEQFPDPKANGFIRDTLGVAYLKKGQLDKAIQNLREAVRKDPCIVPRFHLTLALLENQDAPAALQELKVLFTSRSSLETPHAEEYAILERVQSNANQIEAHLTSGGAESTQPVLQLLRDLL
jgi:tetratricopeptide (TPR) repeat protein